jgi:hypothetical protein
MSDTFDPYHVWLGIPPAAQPPDHYRLLGLERFEADPTVIDNAADRQMAHIRACQTGPHGQASQKLLTEIAVARGCLHDPVAKASYDEKLVKTEPSLQAVSFGQAVPSVHRTVNRPRYGKRSVPLEIAKIILGGLAGVTIAVVLLRYVGGIDVFGTIPQPIAAPGSVKPAMPITRSIESPASKSRTPDSIVVPQDDNPRPPTAPMVGQAAPLAVTASTETIASVEPVGGAIPATNVPVAGLPESAWCGLGMHTKGPAASKEFQRVALEFMGTHGELFTAKYTWITYATKELGRGEYQVEGSLNGENITWSCEANGARASGSLRDDVLFFVWEAPPYYGENWYVPAANQEKAAAQFTGRYQIMEGGKAAFVLTLKSDGAAAKSHAPRVSGAWLATNERVMIVWADGWRDRLVKQNGAIKKEAFGPGVSITATPTNTGIARKLD